MRQNTHSWDSTTFVVVPEAPYKIESIVLINQRTSSCNHDICKTMARFVFALASVVYSLLAITTGVGATCQACPNCDYDQISIEQGNACLNYWTCSGDTISCFYPSVENPGTYTECSYSASADWGLTSGGDLCSYSGITKFGDPNCAYNLGVPACAASYGYVGGVNSGLL